MVNSGISLIVQWLGLGASTVAGAGSIPGQGTRILKALQGSQIIIIIKYNS